MEQLNTFEGSYYALLILRAVLSVFIILLMILFIYLGALKRANQQLINKKNKLQSMYGKEIFDISNGKKISFSKMTSFIHALSFSKAFAAFLGDSQVKVNAHQRLLSTINKSMLIDIIDKNLSSKKKWGVRYQAVEAFLELGIPETFGRVLQHAATEDNVYVYSHCLYVCSRLAREQQQLNGLINLINQREAFSTNFIENIFRNLIQSFVKIEHPEILFSGLKNCLDSDLFSINLKIGIINAIGKEKRLEFKPKLISLAKSLNDAAVSISVMRAIANMQRFDSFIFQHLESRDPVVQTVAIRSSLYCDVSVLPSLARQLESPNFEVRFAAAMTLVKTGKNGRHFLEEVVLAKDRYASNVATFALAAGI